MIWSARFFWWCWRFSARRRCTPSRWTKSSPIRRWRPAPARSRTTCAAWCARTSRSTIPRRRWRAICACWCASGSRPATATAQVVDFMVARYGEFVLLKPRMSWHTAILWGGAADDIDRGPVGDRLLGAAPVRQVALPEVAELSEAERLQAERHRAVAIGRRRRRRPDYLIWIKAMAPDIGSNASNVNVGWLVRDTEGRKHHGLQRLFSIGP